MDEGVKILLETIVGNQEDHGKKLDGLKDDVHRIEMCAAQSENKILGIVSKEYVKKDEFPRLMKEQRKKDRLENMKDFATGTGFAENIKQWVFWIIVLFGGMFGADRLMALFK